MFLPIGRYWLNVQAIQYVYKTDSGDMQIHFASGGSGANVVILTGDDQTLLLGYLLRHAE